MKQSLECIFSQGNAYRTQFLKTEMYSITGFWITSYWVLVLSWWESLAWDFLVHLTRSCYDCKSKGIRISTLQRMSLLPRKTLSIFLTPDKRKHNLYPFLCIKCLHVQIWERWCTCLTCTLVVLVSILSATCVVDALPCASTSTKYCHTTSTATRIWHRAFCSSKSTLNNLRALSLGQPRSWFLKKVHCRQIPKGYMSLSLSSHIKRKF